MPSSVSLHELLQSVMQPMKNTAAASGKHLCHFHDPALPLKLYNQQEELRRILSLILDTTITETEASEVSCAVTQLLQWDTATILRFRFDDNGPAFQHELSPNYKRHMARAQFLIQQLNGSSEVVTAPGYTNSFQFLLQFKSQRPMAEPKPLAYKPKILVVDQHEVNQQNLQNLLHQWRMPHSLATQSREAIRKLERGYEPDLILISADMPVIDGAQFTRYMRHIMRNETPIIGMFAQNDVELIERALDAGMNDYTLKPFAPTQLLEHITTGCEQRHIA